MDDLVSKQAAIDVINSAMRSYMSPTIALHAARDNIRLLPSVKLKQKTGEWIKVHGYVTPGGDPVWKCSECGKGVHVYGIEHGTYGAHISDGQWVSCPNCGADMRGEQDV